MALKFLLVSSLAALAVSTPQQRTTGWVTIPAFCDKTTTPRVPINPDLPPGDQVAFDLINSFRSSHENTPRLSYNTTLAALALSCANQFAQADGFNLESYNGMCPYPSLGTAIGFTPSLNQIDAIRYVLADSTQIVNDANNMPRYKEPFGWFAGYEMIPGINPFSTRLYGDRPGMDDSDAQPAAMMPRDIRAKPYIQMIWASARQVGCGYSSRATTYMPKYMVAMPVPTEYRLVVCLFDVPAVLGGGDFQLQLDNIKPRIINTY